jgi:hypothetical protein
MSTSFVKKYPRAKVTRHPSLNGWVIDILLRETAKPKRVSATYSSIAWAHKAAGLKLGVKATVTQRPAPAKGFERFERKRPVSADAGTCTPCGRPMRPAGTKAVDYPGTTLRQRDGLCQSCNNRIQRETA